MHSQSNGDGLNVNGLISVVIRCGSVTAYLSLDFTQSVKIPEVLSVLKIAAEGNGFGDFQVDSGSIQAISDDRLPTDSPISIQAISDDQLPTDSPISTQDPAGTGKR